MDSDRDKKVKRIARFLELGGTMLAEHCKVCGAPKFRYQGTVICPICDVREEGEETPAPEPAAEVQVPEVQVPEARSSPERDRPSPEQDRSSTERDRAPAERDRSSFDARKKVQARRPKTRFVQRVPEAEEEEDKALQFSEEEIPEPSYEAEAARSTIPEVQAVPAVREERKPEQTMVSTAHGDREVLENLLFEKMVSIAASLQNEKNPRSIAEQLELIEKGIGLIERLRRI